MSRRSYAERLDKIEQLHRENSFPWFLVAYEEKPGKVAAVEISRHGNRTACQFDSVDDFREYAARFADNTNVILNQNVLSIRPDDLTAIIQDTDTDDLTAIKSDKLSPEKVLDYLYSGLVKQIGNI